MFRIFAFVYYGLLKSRENQRQRRKSVRDHVKHMKKAGTKGVQFDCDGYIVRIYKPGTNMDGPWDA